MRPAPGIPSTFYFAPNNRLTWGSSDINKLYVSISECFKHIVFVRVKFCKVLEICQRRSTSMISNDTESQSEYSMSQYY